MIRQLDKMRYGFLVLSMVVGIVTAGPDDSSARADKDDCTPAPGAQASLVLGSAR